MRGNVCDLFNTLQNAHTSQDHENSEDEKKFNEEPKFEKIKVMIREMDSSTNSF